MYTKFKDRLDLLIKELLENGKIIVNNKINKKLKRPSSVYRFKTTNKIDTELYQAYLTEVSNTMGVGLQTLYEELTINEQYQKI